MRVLLAFLLACFAVPAVAMDLDVIGKRATENVVQVGGGCSGTIIANRLVLTAYHCIDNAVAEVSKPSTDANGEIITGPDGKPVMKKEKKTVQVPIFQFFWDDKGEKSEIAIMTDIVARDAVRDVAILRIPEKAGPVVINTAATTDVTILAKGEKLRIGEPVWHVGNPMMIYGTVTKGIYSGPRSLADYGIDGVRMFVQYDGGIVGGSSARRPERDLPGVRRPG
jgi:S1-C subfamily serine protease